MKPWTRNKDIKRNLEKRWDKGQFLVKVVEADPFDPFRMPLKRPNAGELTCEFEAAREWMAHLVRHGAGENKPGFSIEWQTINHRVLGKNKIPKAVVFYALEDVISYLGKKDQARRFEALFHKIVARLPELKAPLLKKPMLVLAHESVWDKLLAVVSWMKVHPRPQIYLRQLEIAGIDTKFIETHKDILTRLLTAVLSPDAVNQGVKGKHAFEQRFGFRCKPARIRLRILDPALSVMGLTDLEVPEDQFRELNLKPDTVFVVENEITGLAFPPFPDGVMIIGLGYGLSVLSHVPWINRRHVWYWGDLDTHGFAMLDRIRHYLPQTRSFLMDEDTLLAHNAFWGNEPSPTQRDLPLLTPDEANVYNALCRNIYAQNLRLEQERISYALVLEFIRAIDPGRT
ncbi:Wadjet anti-phage system protein JetD domain-containing protein [Desulfobacter latus]|uniref:Wadjet protein JetD C-terminal domain-containing protein n=1 Tax=Desulfobacter latus TaxID=2292 RepID=A0A850T0A2_9BACT|nr:Wadjet anti-phage system protein JetD domain-containing protein [Desulfobacter latus]NWH05123.1 hypothetical protein [Desulfobacter latus]